MGRDLGGDFAHSLHGSMALGVLCFIVNCRTYIHENMIYISILSFLLTNSNGSNGY